LLGKEKRPDLADPLAVNVAWMADGLQLARQTIIPALKADQDVVLDRYLFASYRALRRWDLHLSPWFHDLIKEMPTPAVSVYLYAPYEVWEKRMSERPPRDRTECSRSEYEQRIAGGLEIAQANRMMILNTSEYKIGDCIAKVSSALLATRSPEPRSDEPLGA
jgi:thymidylate kinase